METATFARTCVRSFSSFQYPRLFQTRNLPPFLSTASMIFQVIATLLSFDTACECSSWNCSRMVRNITVPGWSVYALPNRIITSFLNGHSMIDLASSVDAGSSMIFLNLIHCMRCFVFTLPVSVNGTKSTTMSKGTEDKLYVSQAKMLSPQRHNATTYLECHTP